MVPKIGLSLETKSDLSMAQLDQLDFRPTVVLPSISRQLNDRNKSSFFFQVGVCWDFSGFPTISKRVRFPQGCFKSCWLPTLRDLVLTGES
jgi:hypothetical protein